MPRNKISNDLNHATKDLETPKTLKARRLDPWPLPKYKPVRVIKSYAHGHGHLLNLIL